MSLTKAKGNMYPWVTHTHTHLGGECPHKCIYCYVNGFRGRAKKYQGELRLIEDEFKVNYGTGKTIFIEHCNDLFAAAVPDDFIVRILEHCREWPSNTYVFQTKNPSRYRAFLNIFPPNTIFGTTVETNREIPNISNAPAPITRLLDMIALKCMRWKVPTPRIFITIEPVLDFDVDMLALIISKIEPEFLNLGADSKHHNLPEPSQAKIGELVLALKEAGIEIREKHNLQRLVKRGS